jgi:hypothetical protein
MCTYITEQTAAQGSGKGPDGWFPLTGITAYYDHPVHAQCEHSFNLDFTNSGRGPAARVAVELTTGSAVDLVRAVARVLSQVPADLTGVDPQRARALLAAADELAQRPEGHRELVEGGMR